MTGVRLENENEEALKALKTEKLLMSEEPTFLSTCLLPGKIDGTATNVTRTSKMANMRCQLLGYAYSKSKPASGDQK